MRRALLGLTQVKQIDAAHEIINKGLSVREAEKLAQRMLKPAVDEQGAAGSGCAAPAGRAGGKARRARDAVTAARAGKGRLSIDYDNLEQLDNILGRL